MLYTAEPRSEFAGCQATCYYSSEFEKWLWCLHRLFSHPPSLPPCSSLSETDSSVAEDTFDTQPRRGIFHQEWCQLGHLRLAKTQTGRYTDWHVAAESRVESSSDWLRQIHWDGPHTDTTGAGSRPHTTLHLYSGDPAATALSSAQWRIRISNRDLRFKGFLTKQASTETREPSQRNSMLSPWQQKVHQVRSRTKDMLLSFLTFAECLHHIFVPRIKPLCWSELSEGERSPQTTSTVAWCQLGSPTWQPTCSEQVSSPWWHPKCTTVLITQVLMIAWCNLEYFVDQKCKTIRHAMSNDWHQKSRKLSHLWISNQNFFATFLSKDKTKH